MRLERERREKWGTCLMMRLEWERRAVSLGAEVGDRVQAPRAETNGGHMLDDAARVGAPSRIPRTRSRGSGRGTPRPEKCGHIESGSHKAVRVTLMLEPVNDARWWTSATPSGTIEMSRSRRPSIWACWLWTHLLARVIFFGLSCTMTNALGRREESTWLAGLEPLGTGGRRASGRSLSVRPERSAEMQSTHGFAWRHEVIITTVESLNFSRKSHRVRTCGEGQ